MVDLTNSEKQKYQSPSACMYHKELPSSFFIDEFIEHFHCPTFVLKIKLKIKSIARTFIECSLSCLNNILAIILPNLQDEKPIVDKVNSLSQELSCNRLKI